jgi:hypothetical protein
VTELSAFLVSQNADPETVQQAARYLVAELSAADPVAMREALLANGRAADLDAAINALTRSPEKLQSCALFVLSDSWTDPETRSIIERVVPDARGKLPVIEAGLLALVTLYGLYLHTTKGVTRTERIVERKPDGSLVERQITEYHHPAEVLKVIPELLSGSDGESRDLSDR